MKKILALVLAVLLLTGCGEAAVTTPETAAPTTEAPTTEAPTVPETTVPTTETPTTAPTEPPTTAPTEAPTVPPTTAATEPTHSALYMDGLSVEDVIRYFNEVCLDAEFINSGNPNLLQKWVIPIRYAIEGQPTEKDMAVLENFEAWLNTIPGFPGMAPAESQLATNLTIHFCTEQELLSILGDNFSGTDGGVTFWYNGANQIYTAVICYRTDLEQYTRNSVILEEIYNGLGPVQDTNLRADSMIYSGFSTPQELTAVDELILKLLYSPEMKCGMTVTECEAVIRSLYY